MANEAAQQLAAMQAKTAQDMQRIRREQQGVIGSWGPLAEEAQKDLGFFGDPFGFKGKSLKRGAAMKQDAANQQRQMFQEQGLATTAQMMAGSGMQMDPARAGAARQLAEQMLASGYSPDQIQAQITGSADFNPAVGLKRDQAALIAKANVTAAENAAIKSEPGYRPKLTKTEQMQETITERELQNINRIHSGQAPAIEGKTVMAELRVNPQSGEIEMVGTFNAPSFGTPEYLKQEEGMAGAIKTIRATSHLSDMLLEHGTEYFGANADEMDAYAVDAQLGIKDQAKLGTLDTGSIPFMESLIRNPSDFLQNVESITKGIWGNLVDAITFGHSGLSLQGQYEGLNKGWQKSKDISTGALARAIVQNPKLLDTVSNDDFALMNPAIVRPLLDAYLIDAGRNPAEIWK